MVRELTTADGAFAASQDADTDGVEGLTFTWTAAEIREVLGADAAPFLAAYGVTDLGNWEGSTILSRAWPDVAHASTGARPTPPSRLVSPRREPSSSSDGSSGRSPPATTRRSRPGTGWRSPPSPTRGGSLRRCRATSPRRRAPPRRSPVACSPRTGRSADRGRTAGRPGRASSRTTPISPTACWPCTRPRSTSAGSRSPGR